ncbi:hypothetical protein [Pseudoalteromonas byunsanensis]|uniref:Uncharacterized protein n=1 Tax=Pseudoalteromonas byunsanensis TaxID=327939 RepID=A0A1S1NEN9_9GAMM|nr:hypothetical protein [Pseudoalteromonas byunsanensis]OHU96833.1 hypothetical protein BIW53_05795 [Pseudoalteromonas byunsanensis]
METNVAGLVSQQQQAAILEKQQKQFVRGNINQQVADNASLLGTTSDTTHILLNELSGFINKLSQAQSLAEMRASTESLKAAIGNIEQQMTDGTLEFPYQVKGQAQVMSEICARAQGVSQILKQS